MNKSYKTFKIIFTSPLHISKGKNEYDVSEHLIHSDTLKSAIFASALQIFGDKINSNFLDKFTISSAFPFYKDEYFFPKPFTRLEFKIENTEDGSKHNKKLKKIQYVGKSYFEKILKNEKNVLIPKKHLFENGELLTDYLSLDGSKTENVQNLSIYENDVQQRVFIPYNHESDAKPYYFDRIYFQPDAGLYFIIETDDETYALVNQSLALLKDNGIGSDRTVGNGQFELFESEVTIDIPDNSNKMVNMSLYCPTRKELADDFLVNSSYNLKKRGGYIASPDNIEHLTIRKKSAYMFVEGSVFPKSEIIGKLLDLKPTLPEGMINVEHPIWRDGRAIFFNLITD